MERLVVKASAGFFHIFSSIGEQKFHLRVLLKRIHPKWSINETTFHFPNQ